MNVILEGESNNRSHPNQLGLWEKIEVSPQGISRERRNHSAFTSQNSQPLLAEREQLQQLFEKVFSKANLSQALKRVEANKGAPGVDNMTTDQLRPWLHGNWPEVLDFLQRGTYRSMPTKMVTIPKASGGMRTLGVPTVLDRLIQQSIVQVLSQIFEPIFSGSSFGFRPKRSAHQALLKAQEYINGGYRYAVSIDLENFFDMVNHDALMAKVARKITDKKLLKLIRAYLNSGITIDGAIESRAKGTPQGSPLSPLLSNIMLNDLDTELERRGHLFVRYGDDLTVFVKSRRAGERVLTSISKFIESRLKLKVNQRKSSVGTAQLCVILGYSFYYVSKGTVGFRIAQKSKVRLKHKLRKLTGRSWRISMEDRLTALNLFISGWTNYFSLIQSPKVFKELDQWLRRRLRRVRWKEWKWPKARFRNLRALGLSRNLATNAAGSGKGSWRLSASQPLTIAMGNQYWEKLGLQGFEKCWNRRRLF